MKKFTSLFLVICIFASLVANAFATGMQGDAILITVKTQEDYDAVVAEIEAHNSRADQLWQQALAESGASALPSPVWETNGIMPRIYRVASVNYRDWIGALELACVAFSATFNTTTNQYGSEMIGEVYNISAYGYYGSTTVSVNNSQYAIIDSGRTISAQFSCQVGIRHEGESYYTYYTRSYYVEFYVNGNANVL